MKISKAIKGFKTPNDSENPKKKFKSINNSLEQLSEKEKLEVLKILENDTEVNFQYHNYLCFNSNCF